ncbi:lecithin retinol acyltransferase family protein [Bacillus bombysepticus]|uniref:lecithin retinol acyltransferase family protein n=1 Tax=Bacillus bombysepticus TaxID=658666 RepID=UPI00301B586A
MEFEIGSHLVATRRKYTHHGIYIGNDMVIHYAGLAEGLKKDRVRKVNIDEFKGKGNITVQENFFLFKKRFPPEEIVKRAKSRIGETRYNVLWNNCETFANWCTHGKEYSEQTEGAKDFSGNPFGPRPDNLPVGGNPLRLICSVGRFVDKQIHKFRSRQ